MQTEISLDDEQQRVNIYTGNPPFRLHFEYQQGQLYELLKSLPQEEWLETIVSRAGYESHGLYPEHEIGTHSYERYYKVKSSDTVVDAGSHIGLWTERFSNIVGPNGLVIAFDTDYRNIGYSYQSLYYRKNVKIVPVGLWDEKDYMSFGIGEGSGTSSFFSFIGMKKQIGFQVVRVNTLDNILEELNVKKVDFIKMDIEGAEVRALKGMTETLKHTNALAIAAYHKTMEYPDNTVEAVKKILEDANFDVHVGFSSGEMVYANRAL